MSEFVPGQRWLSEMEPELGIGIVTEVEHRRVRLNFPASACNRQYVKDSAPLKRVRFRVGDKIQVQKLPGFTITAVREVKGLLFYSGKDIEISETDLAHTLTFNSPEARFFGAQFDSVSLFNLRFEGLELQHKARKSSIRGFIGGRVELIPHQFYIAQQVVNRHIPRVLLADEVGLGKTIEACLILHRLLVSGRIRRVLILVPESLVHQWFIELYRRFSLFFRIVDPDQYLAATIEQPGGNPFPDDQLFISDLDFMAATPACRNQVLESQWDLIVVDEAHHLDEASHAYEFVAALAAKTPGLLLLTATPEQVGQRNHFSRLKLLDPARYPSFDKFLAESKNYRQIARISGKLLDGQKLTTSERQTLTTLLTSTSGSTPVQTLSSAPNDAPGRQSLVEQILDQHGVGRVMFRNTRAAMTSFPRRVVELCELTAAEEPGALHRQLAEEFTAEAPDKPNAMDYRFQRDPRIHWLAQLARKLKGDKILLICRTWQKAEAIEAALRQEINTKTALFHEGMTLVQRDRKAAWFSEKDGAQVLLCSEIGSEGRNFQFAHHLVLFDVPLNPELLEQRIGRLDRIGQRQAIYIHVPFIPATGQHALIRWLHEGLNVLEQNITGGHYIFARFGQAIQKIANQYPNATAKTMAELEKLIEKTRLFRAGLEQKLVQGRDRLLELNSYRPGEAEKLIQAIRTTDADRVLDAWMEKIFDHFGIIAEDLGERILLLMPGNMTVAAFPGLQEEGTTVTFDRKKATAREEIEFLTWDHPMVIGAMDLLLGAEKGNSCLAIWNSPDRAEMLLETIFVLETVAPLTLQADRFLPASPIRVLLNQNDEDCGARYPTEQLKNKLKTCLQPEIVDLILAQDRALAEMLDASRRVAERRAEQMIRAGLGRAEEQLGYEISRLKSLYLGQQTLDDREIAATETELSELRQHIAKAQLRLDAVRLILKGPEEFWLDRDSDF